MIRVLRFTLAAALCVAIAWWVHGLPGTVSARVGTLVFQTSTPVALLLATVLFVVLYLFVRFLGALVRLPGWRQRRQDARRRARGDESVTRALVALAAGDAAAARREAARSRNLLGDTPMTLLLAAQAARLAGSDDDASALYRRLAAPAPRDRTGAAFLGFRGLFRQAMDRSDWDAAARYAAEADRVQPGAAWLRDERARLALRTGQWRDAMRLGQTSADVMTEAANAEPNASAARKLARAAWEADPALTPAALAYASRLRKAGKEYAAGDVVRRAWSLCPHPDLAAFALLPAKEDLARIRAAADLVRFLPDSPDSHLLLGRVALGAGLIGEAHRHAEAARGAGLRQRRLHHLFAEIAEAEGDAAAARAALRNEASAEPDPVWRCEACHAVHDQWHAVCPACGTAGRVRWTAQRFHGPNGDAPPARLLQAPSEGEEVVLP